jgi:hypothetical protein
MNIFLARGQCYTMLVTIFAAWLLRGGVTAQLEDSAISHQSSHLDPTNHHERELRTIFCRCVADFETFYDRRQLKSYFHYDGDLPSATSLAERKSLRTTTSRYYKSEGYYGKSSRQSTTDAIVGPDGFYIVDGITVLPLDDEACIVSQTNSALRSFLTLIFRPLTQATNQTNSIRSFTNLFQKRNRRLANDKHEIDQRFLQGWSTRRKNKPNKPGRVNSGTSLRDKTVQNILNTDLSEQIPDNVGSAKPRPQPSPSGFPRVFPCPPTLASNAPSFSPSENIDTLFPSSIPVMIMTDQPTLLPDETTVPANSIAPTISFQPSISAEPTTTVFPTISQKPTVSPVPTVAPTSKLVVTEMPSDVPSTSPSSFTLAPSVTPSISPKPSISPVPTNVETIEPTLSKAPTISPKPSVDPTTSLSPSTLTQTPSVSNLPSIVPTLGAALPSSRPTISMLPTISAAPTISSAPNGISQAPLQNIEPTISVQPSVSDMPSFVPSFSDRPSAVPSFPPSMRPTISALPTTPPVLNITDSMDRLRPRNNLCDEAMPLPMDGSPMSGTTVYGTNEVDYGCDVNGGIQTDISPGVWFTATGNGNIYEISTCSDRTNFGTAIQVLIGGCENLQCLRNAGRLFDRECSKSDSEEWSRFGSRVRIETIPDEVYSFLVLSRLGANFGDFDIRLEEITTPSNDRCDNAIAMEVDVPKLHIGNTVNSTIGTKYGCGSLSLGVNNVASGLWYVAEGNGETFSASTCAQWTNFNTAIQVFTGDTCDELRCLAGSSSDSCFFSSGSSTVSFPTEPGKLYYIYVFGRQESDAGTFILTLTSFDPTL